MAIPKLNTFNDADAFCTIAHRINDASSLVISIDDAIQKIADEAARELGFRPSYVGLMADISIRLLNVLSREMDGCQAVADSAERRAANDAGAEPAPHADMHAERAWTHSLLEWEGAPEDAKHSKLRALIYTRTPDLNALREKVRIARAQVGDAEQFPIFTQLLADIDRLN